VGRFMSIEASKAIPMDLFYTSMDKNWQ